MSRGELLAWAGVVLGIPPLVYMVFKEGKWSAGVFVVLLLIALMRGYLNKKRPPFTLLRVTKSYTFTDSTAHDVTVRDVRLIRANHRATEFIISHYGGDGSVTTIEVDGVPANVRTAGHRKEIVKQFLPELRPGDEREVVTSYHLLDSFPSDPEGVIHIVEYETRTVDIEIKFAQDRPCINCSLIRRYGGASLGDGYCRKSEDGSGLSVTVVKPLIGAEYLLQWRW
jgi:hypothetical protein